MAGSPKLHKYIPNYITPSGVVKFWFYVLGVWDIHIQTLGHHLCSSKHLNIRFERMATGFSSELAVGGDFWWKVAKHKPKKHMYHLV